MNAKNTNNSNESYYWLHLHQRNILLLNVILLHRYGLTKPLKIYAHVNSAIY